MDIRQLCSADQQRPLKLQVWDHQSSGDHQLIGECHATLAQLLEVAAAPPTARTLELAAPPSSKKAGAAGAGATPGKLLVRQVVVRPGATLSQSLGSCLGACLGD